MTVTRRQLEDATRRRFDFESDNPGPHSCEVEGCDRPAAAYDIDDSVDLCLMHILERIGFILSFPARTSVPSRVIPQRGCDICDAPATSYIVMDFREYGIADGQGGGSQHEWVVCREHHNAKPRWVKGEKEGWIECVLGEPEER